MCGICGFLGNLSPSALNVMCRAISHRGPDDEGIYYDQADGIGLGHRRLSIIDLSPAGHQPMRNEDSTIWVSFNGEIYNYVSLRKELVNKGHEFRSQTDTEVLIHLYEELDISFLEELNGMFAVALWDSRKKRLLLARDRIGIKPLYYLHTHKLFAFASEIKALFAADLVPRKISLSALQEYLAIKYVSGSHTIVEGVHKVEPGQWLSIDSQGAVKKGYFWKYTTTSEHFQASPLHAAEELRNLLDVSIRDQMIADVPVGVFLSGGIDSSVVIKEMARSSGSKVKAFTVNYDSEGSSKNEAELAKIIVNNVGADHYVVECSNELSLRLMPLLVYHLDEPISEPLVAPSFLLSKMAHEKVKIVLTGDGSDELFGGYPRYKVGYYSQLLKNVPFGIRRRILRLSERMFGDQALLSRVVRTGVHPEKVCDWSLVFTSREIEAISGISCPVDQKVYAASTEPNAEEIIELLMEQDFRRRLPEYILVRSDKMSMANSLELRVPFLDNRVVDFATRLPTRLKLNSLKDKYLLRLAYSNILPQSLKKRRKLAFSAPLDSWLKPLISKYLRNSELVSEGILVKKEVEKILNGNAFYKGRLSEKIFSLIILELWFRIFITRTISQPFSDPPMPVINYE